MPLPPAAAVFEDSGHAGTSVTTPVGNRRSRPCRDRCPPTMFARHAVLPTPSVSPRLSHLPRCRQREHSNFRSPYTLPSSVSSKSFACHSYENCRGGYQQFPFWLDHSGREGLAPFPKSFICNTYKTFSKCCKQKTYGKANPFRCNTYKKPGVGWAKAPLPPEPPLHPLPPKTATPFPQRWGQLRKGRTVFRREDRVDRFTVAKNNGRLLTVVKNVERFTLAKNNDRLTVAKNNGRLLTV